jgi:succinate dehydrogenase / fumarate reductase membrane anchor subunit
MMSYKTDMSRVIGLGSAKEGVEHWWGQRVTAIALIPLTLLFIFPLAAVMGHDWEEARAVYAHPFNAIIAILFIVVMFRHLGLGLQVVIEDYVHGKAARTAAMLANTGFCWFFGLTGVFAVAKIAFGG